MHWYVLIRVLFVTISGFTWGYDLGSMNGVKDMKGYRTALNLSYTPSEDGLGNATESCSSEDDVETTAILGLIVSLLPVGCLFGALLGGVLSDLAGRKPAIIIGASLVSCSGLIHIAALNLWMVLLSRIIGGFGLGILFQVVPLYVAEISPEALRGRLLSFNNLYGTVGSFVGSIVNLIVKDYLFGWRISVGLPFVVGTLLALGMFLLPRSPRWLVKRHRDKQALDILTNIYKDPNRAQTQLEEIQSTVSSAKEPFMQTLKYLTRWKILKRLLIGFVIMIIGRSTGINFINFFSVSIFCGIGLPGFEVSVGLTVVVFLSMLLSFAVIDKLGRKPVFLITLSMMIFSLVASATLILVFHLESNAVDSIFSRSQLVAGYFVLVIVSLYLGAGSVAVGCVPWIIVSEIFPLRGRGFMVSVTNTGFWLGVVVTNQISPILANSPLNISGTLFIFSGITFFLLLFVLLLLPETKGLTLEKVEEVFAKPWSERTNVLYYLRCACFLEFFSKKRTRLSGYRKPESNHVSMDDISQSTDTSSVSSGSPDQIETDVSTVLLVTEL